MKLDRRKELLEPRSVRGRARGQVAGRVEPDEVPATGSRDGGSRALVGPDESSGAVDGGRLGRRAPVIELLSSRRPTPLASNCRAAATATAIQRSDSRNRVVDDVTGGRHEVRDARRPGLGRGAPPSRSDTDRDAMTFRGERPAQRQSGDGSRWRWHGNGRCRGRGRRGRQRGRWSGTGTTGRGGTQKPGTDDERHDDGSGAEADRDELGSQWAISTGR